MQDAETVLAVLRERGRKGLPCDELYRQLFNKELYLLAYGRIYANQGAMTPGASAETADGMTEAKIDQIIEAMRHERYRFAPARRVLIPKKNGKMRPLGLPSWSDKLVGEVVRLLLEAYYEPQFSDRSHGFRKRRGCHTALREIQRTWTGTVWFIEADISDCFGSLDHDIMVRTLAEKIHDNRFLRLIGNMLKAGYLEDWHYRETLSALRRVAWCHRSSRISTWTSWISSSSRCSSRDTPEEKSAGTIWNTGGSTTGDGWCASAATGQQPGNCSGRCGHFAVVIPWTPDTGGCGTAATPTISSWGSPGRRPRPRRSRTSWRRCCAMNSRWSCRQARR